MGSLVEAWLLKSGAVVATLKDSPYESGAGRSDLPIR